MADDISELSQKLDALLKAHTSQAQMAPAQLAPAQLAACAPLFHHIPSAPMAQVAPAQSVPSLGARAILLAITIQTAEGDLAGYLEFSPEAMSNLPGLIQQLLASGVPLKIYPPRNGGYGYGGGPGAGGGWRPGGPSAAGGQWSGGNGMGRTWNRPWR